MALLPLDFIPIETSHGMSVITALVLVGFGVTVYYTIRWLNSRITKVEKMTSRHDVDIAITTQSERSIAKSVDIIRDNLDDAVGRIEDRFQSIQESINQIKR